VECWWGGPDIRWFTATLQSATSTCLQRINVDIYLRHAIDIPVAEALLREWETLDNLLARLWTSRLIRPKVKFWTGEGECVQDLLPELTRMGVVDRQPLQMYQQCLLMRDVVL
jgi:hypothetical protein